LFSKKKKKEKKVRIRYLVSIIKSSIGCEVVPYDGILVRGHVVGKESIYDDKRWDVE
jgi:hypothetical protein